MTGHLNRGLESILWGLGVRGISPTASRVLLRLCSRINGGEHRQDYDTWPSHAKLAEESEISVSSVKRHLEELKSAGLIRQRETHRTDGSRTVNCYTLLVHGENTPTQTAEDFKKNTLGQIDLGPVQSEGEPGSNMNGGQFTAEPCNEPSKGTIEESPLPFGKDTPTGEIDLFGKGRDLVTAEIPIADWVHAEWNKLATEIPTIAKIRVLDDARRRKINTRLKTVRNAEPDDRAAWEKIFAAIRANTFLRGEEPPTRDYPEPFRLDLDFVLRPSQFIKILEGGYRATRTANTHDLRTGRRFGPAEQAGRNAVRGILAAGQEPGVGTAAGGDPSVDGAGPGQGGRLRSAFDQYRDDEAGRR